MSMRLLQTVFFVALTGITAANASPLPCGTSSISVTGSTQPVTLRIINVEPFPIVIEWIAFQGNYKEYRRIAPNERFDQPTFQSHAWVARDERGRCISAFMVQAQGELWVVRGPPTADDYESQRLDGITVMVSSEFKVRDPLALKECLSALSASLLVIRAGVPDQVFRFFTRIVIWLDYDDPMFPSGSYHPSAEWLAIHGRDPQRARTIQFTRSLATTIRTQPMMVLHELAHAYHDQVLGYDDQRMIDAYKRARASGRYDRVRRITGGQERAYAMNNEQEFFAELSEAYFGTNDYFPFTRDDLRAFDPYSYQVIADAWNRH
jgi:hypothetical protein